MTDLTWGGVFGLHASCTLLVDGPLHAGDRLWIVLKIKLPFSFFKGLEVLVENRAFLFLDIYSKRLKLSTLY